MAINIKKRQQTGLYKLKQSFDALLDEMQTPRAKRAANSISTVTAKELGEAAARYRKNEESNYKK